MDIEKKRQLTERFVQLAATEYSNERYMGLTLAREFASERVFYGEHVAEISIINERSKRKPDMEDYFQGVSKREIGRTPVTCGNYLVTFLLYEYKTPERFIKPLYAFEFEIYKKQLELEDISGFIPYGLDVLCLNPETETHRQGRIVEIQQADKSFDKVRILVDVRWEGLLEFRLEEIKPILKPFREIFENDALEGLFSFVGRSFIYTRVEDVSYVPSKSVLQIIPDQHRIESKLTTYEMSKIVRWCYRNMYDIDNLIGHGLAYDDNKLSKIPYHKAY